MKDNNFFIKKMKKVVMTKYKTIITDNSINIYEHSQNFLMSFKNECSILERREFVHYGIMSSQTINNNDFLIFIQDQEFVGVINKERYYKITGTEIIFTRIENLIEAKYLKEILIKILKEQDFFYKNQKLFDTNFILDEYVFNSHLFSDRIYDELLAINPMLFKPVMFGSIETYEFPGCKVSLICKRSNFGMGTRLLSRGLVAPYLYPTNNTELTFYLETKQKIYTNIQLRGSIPLFWYQKLLYTYNPPFNLPYNNMLPEKKLFNTLTPIDIKTILEENDRKYKNKFMIQNSINLRTTPIAVEINTVDEFGTVNDIFFQDYKEHLQQKYKGNIIFVNLLKWQGPERNLFLAYDSCLKRFKVNHINFDISFNKNFEPQGFIKEIRNIIPKKTVRLAGFISSRVSLNDLSVLDKKTNTILKAQTNFVRTNCIDSSDRTTHFQSKIINDVLKRIRSDDKLLIISDEIVTDMYLNASKKLSKQYTGTESLLFSFTKLRKDFFLDGVKSLKRYFINRFTDGYKNDAYKIFTGAIKPLKFHKRRYFNWFVLFYLISLLPLFFFSWDFVKENRYIKLFVVLVFIFMFFRGIEFNEGCYS